MKDNLKNKMLASVLLGSITLGGCSGSGGGGSSTTPTPSNPVVTYSPSQTVQYFKDNGFEIVSGANPTYWEITGTSPSNQQITYLQNQNSNDCSILTSAYNTSRDL